MHKSTLAKRCRCGQRLIVVSTQKLPTKPRLATGKLLQRASQVACGYTKFGGQYTYLYTMNYKSGRLHTLIKRRLLIKYTVPRIKDRQEC